MVSETLTHPCCAAYQTVQGEVELVNIWSVVGVGTLALPSPTQLTFRVTEITNGDRTVPEAGGGLQNQGHSLYRIGISTGSCLRSVQVHL